jgi:hypothetical protein
MASESAEVSQERVEFASDEWLKRAAAIAKDLVAKHGKEVVGERLTVCEIFHHPPAHFGHGDRPMVWTLVLAHDHASAESVETPDADFRIEVEYEAALPNARRINPEAGALEPGGPLAAWSPAMRLMVRRLHNRLAAITL